MSRLLVKDEILKIEKKKIANVEGRLGASFLASFGNAGGRRRDTDKLIRLNGIDRYRWEGRGSRKWA